MNNERRKALKSIMEETRTVQSKLERISSDERDAFDGLTEGLQATMRGSQLEENADKLDEAVGIFDEIIDLIEETMY